MATIKPDCYKTLGIPKTATADDIKKAYRKLAMKYHPDMAKKKGMDPKVAEEKFKELGEAYSILSNSDKRAAYDRFGWPAFDQGYQPPSQGGPFRTVYSQNIDIDPFEIFQEFFGKNFDPFSSFFSDSSRGSSNRQRSTRSRPKRRSSSFFVEDMFGFGNNSNYATYDVPINDRENADFYGQNSGKPTPYQLQITLKEAMEGTSKTFNLDGSMQSMRLNIPPGISNDTTLKVTSQYYPFYVTIDIVTNNPNISVKKNTIFYTLRLPKELLHKGGKIKLPVLSIVIKIPEKSKVGQKLRIKGKGINPDGDLIITLLEK